jgi:septum formation protein
VSKENYIKSKKMYKFMEISPKTDKRAVNMTRNLILASTSTYRAALLAQLGLSFEQIDPNYHETALAEEKPTEMAARLARRKAIAGAEQYLRQHPQNTHVKTAQENIIIGSDQVAHLDGSVFGKPGNLENAKRQLTACGGNWVQFTTAVCLVNSKGDILSEGLESYRIKYRALEESEIERYLKADKPYDCAGSIKAEGLGITIIDDGHGKDINTLYGLPLMMLSKMLRAEGFIL